MESIHLAWGKHKNGENFKTNQTREKFGKPKRKLAAYVSDDSMDPFFSFCLERVSSSRTLCWRPIPFLSPCSFHPPCGPVSTKRMNLSSILRCWTDESVGSPCHGFRVGMTYFLLKPLSVSVSREVSSVQMDGWKPC